MVGSLFYHNSIDEIKKDDSYSTGIDLLYNSKNHGVYSKIIRLVKDLNLILDLLEEKVFLNNILDMRRFWIETEKISNISITPSFRYITKPNKNSLIMDRDFSANFEINFKSLSNLSIDFSYPYTTLIVSLMLLRRDELFQFQLEGITIQILKFLTEIIFLISSRIILKLNLDNFSTEQKGLFKLG